MDTAKYRQQAEWAAERQRKLQESIAGADEQRKGKEEKEQGAMQAGARVYPEPPMEKTSLVQRHCCSSSPCAMHPTTKVRTS